MFNLKQRGVRIDVIHSFEVTGVSIGMSPDTNTVVFAAFGSDDSSVCLFNYENLVWIQQGRCFSVEEFYMKFSRANLT